MRVHENVAIEGGLRIKRIVLLYDENLAEDEIEGYDPQYSGVQLLRGQQWIETLNVRDFIPVDRRAGFRGFAEFDIALERQLKNTEKPQHESFDGRNSLVRQVRSRVSSAVKEFAEERGWTASVETRGAPEQERELATEFLNVFAAGSGSIRRRRGSGSARIDEQVGHSWDCELTLDFPTAKSSRVNWGQFINNVGVSVQCEPPQSTRRLSVSLELTRQGDPALVEVDQKEDVQVQQGLASAEFGTSRLSGAAHRLGWFQCPSQVNGS